MNYYNKEVALDIDPYIVMNPFFEEWFMIVEDILMNDEFQKRKLFMHHHNLSVWDHSILVSFNSFVAASYFNADKRVCAIAGLLHDFYEQAWLDTPELRELDDGKYAKNLDIKKPFFKSHGFTHASSAAKNYVKYFPELEDKRITNCIERHMFPLNIIPPKYFEGYIITAVDKINSCKELPSITFVATKVGKKVKKEFKKMFINVK